MPPRNLEMPSILAKKQSLADEKPRKQFVGAILAAFFLCGSCVYAQDAGDAFEEMAQQQCNSLWIEPNFWIRDLDVDIVSFCLNAGVDVDVRQNGHTALHWAAISTDPGVVGLLLQHGANVNARNSAGATPLHRAAALPRHVAGLPTYSSRQLRDTALSANRDIVITLLAGGASLDARDDRGATPLHYVSDANPEPLVALLLIEAGANVNARNDNGSTPLYFAMKWNSNPEVGVLLMAAGGDPEAANDYGETPREAFDDRNSDFQKRFADRAKELQARMNKGDR